MKLILLIFILIISSGDRYVITSEKYEKAFIVSKRIGLTDTKTREQLNDISDGMIEGILICFIGAEIGFGIKAYASRKDDLIITKEIPITISDLYITLQKYIMDQGGLNELLKNSNCANKIMI